MARTAILISSSASADGAPSSMNATLSRSPGRVTANRQAPWWSPGRGVVPNEASGQQGAAADRDLRLSARDGLVEPCRLSSAGIDVHQHQPPGHLRLCATDQTPYGRTGQVVDRLSGTGGDRATGDH